MADVAIQAGNHDEDSDAIDIVLDQVVGGAAPVYFDDPTEAAPYPLAQKLLGLESLSALLLQDKKITLCRSNTAGEWPAILAAVTDIVTAHFSELPDAAPPRERSNEENQLMAKVQNVLNTELNPMVASHGGFIEVTDVNESRVFINMTGGCQGCGQAAATLKQGVERVLLERLPEITEILDATDHTAGVNPYY